MGFFDKINNSMIVNILKQFPKELLQLLLQSFYGSLDFVRDNPGEPETEGTFRQLLDFLVQMKITQADAPTIWMHCHPIQTNWCPHLCHLLDFYVGCPSWHKPLNLSWLGTAPNMLACIPSGLVVI